MERLKTFRSEHVFVGAHNAEDTRKGFARLDFAPQAAPLGEEGIAENGSQLFGLCREKGINHLIYMGFAINWCLLLSPGGMADMSQRGFMCSAIRQAVTAVENKETSREEWCKEIGLWRVALAFGFVFDREDIMTALA
jgi:nicotinamidase-related amidase